MVRQIKYIPNVLSVARIATAFLLFIDQQPLFIICYLFCGLSDVLDGFIARKYNAQTAFGSKLDSLGDFVFWLIVLVLLYARTEIYTTWLIAGVALTASIRLLNFILTKTRFDQWAVLHTVGNKATGLALYFLCFAAFVFGTAQWYVCVPVFALALLSSVEETVIVCHSTHYEPNPKGFFKISK